MTQRSQLSILGRLAQRQSCQKGFPGGSVVKNAPVNAGNEALIPGRKDLLEKEIETHSSILVWRIPWMEEPGGLQSMALLRVRES